MDRGRDFPTFPQEKSRSQTLEASASTIWTVLFFAYASTSVVAEFGHGWSAAWTVILVIIPISLAGAPAILEKKPRAIPMYFTYLLYAVVPALLQLFKPDDYTSMASEVADLLTVLAIWLPIELKVLSTDFSPTGTVTVWGLLTAALNILNCFMVLRPFSKLEHARELGYTFKLELRDVAVSVGLAALSLVVGSSLAMILRYGKLRRKVVLQENPTREAAVFVGLYMNALTEELLFRGLILNMIEQRWGHHSVFALVVSAVAYALARLNRPKLGFDPPNYRFACMAFFSGIFEGIAWRLTGKVTASAITHAVSDFFVYRVLFSKISSS